MKKYGRSISLILSVVLASMILSSCTVKDAEGELPSADMGVLSSSASSEDTETAVPKTETATVTTSESTVTETSPTETPAVSETATETTPAVTAAPVTSSVPESTTTVPVTSEISSVTQSTTTVSRTETTSVSSETETSASETAETDSGDVRDADPDKLPTAYSLGSNIMRPYCYNFLDEKSVYLYDALLTAINQKKTSVNFSSVMNLSSEDYCAVYELIYNDENAMFFLDTKMQYAVNSTTKNVASANIFYKYSDSKIETMQKEIDSEVDRIISEITPEMTEYDIVKMFYDYLAMNVIYDENAENCRDIYGVFVDKKAICGGYAKALAYLCSKTGIECITITGDADEIPHMWNMVKLGGNWYHIDPTYAVTESRLGSYVRYDYFCVDDEVIAKTRVIYDQNYTYPEAAEDEYNYYVRNGLIANSWDEVKTMLTEQIIAAAENRELVAQIRCGNQEVYDTSVYNLFDRFQAQAITVMEEALDSVENKYQCDNISYSQDDSTFVIKLFLEYTDEA